MGSHATGNCNREGWGSAQTLLAWSDVANMVSISLCADIMFPPTDTPFRITIITNFESREYQSTNPPLAIQFSFSIQPVPSLATR